ncbi:protein toll-like [Diachasmimorpha longicaudata]|uniref:protein toll-like n=1 Tax=Diachasmimorpha longicaudata TaxID=58733 RepID=UPI0030B87499
MYHLKWYVILALMSSAMAFHCPQGMGCGPCQQLPHNIYEVQCETSDLNSDFTVRFKPEEWVRIECYNSPNWTEFHLGTIQQLFHVNSISFRKCELPERENLGDIAKQIMANHIEDLIFQSIGDLTSSLTRDTLADFKNIKRLTLSSNGLKNVTADLLQDLKNLTVLNLHQNDLRDLPHDFLNLPNLKAIELGGNHLEVIEPAAFDKSTKLELLNIWNNQITEIKANSFDKLESLVSLDLHSNKLTQLPENIFAKLGSLRVINLSQNNFTGDSLPGNLFRNNSLLEVVILFENKQNITTLPSKWFANLKDLTMIKMRRNGLIRLPEDLFAGASALRNLSMERNYIEAIPRNLFNDCKNLSTIDLSFNEIKELPDRVFGALKKLEHLDLSKNHITSITQEMFAGLSALKILNLERNGLTTIHPYGLTPLDSLQIVKFSFNQLTLKTPNMIFDEEFGLRSPFVSSIDKIEELHLSHNNISDIFGDWIFSRTLRILDLSHNNFRFLQEPDFKFVSENIDVNLSSNKIERLMLHTVELVFQVAEHKSNLAISIEDNPIICDCNVYDLLRYGEGRMDQSVRDQFTLRMDNLRCHGPSRLKDTPLKDLDSTSFKCLVDRPVIYDALCPNDCSCWVKPENRGYLVDCFNRNLTVAPGELKSPQGLHTELNLTNNLLTSAPSMSQPGYSAVTVLDLSGNRITHLPVSGVSPTLEVLFLQDNQLKSLDSEVLEVLSSSKMLKNLTLHGNPWIADCDSRDFLSFIQTKGTTILELKNVTFESSDAPIFNMTPEMLCPPSFISWMMGVCIGVAVLGVILGILAALYYRYQHNIKVWLYAKSWCLWFVSENELDKDKLYDAFISYSHKDENFVVNNLVGKLESGAMGDNKPFKLCVHYRDWKAGEWIPAQIAHSVGESRRTIVVLSPNFLESVWGKMEFRTAHTQALNEGRARVIVILYGDIGPIEQLEPELKAYLSMNTYIKWGDPWFWDKLRYALPHTKEILKMKKKPSIFETHQPVLQIINEKGKHPIDTINSKILV